MQQMEAFANKRQPPTGCAPTTRAARRAGRQERAVRRPRLHAHLGVLAARAAAGRRARGRAAAAHAALRPCEGVFRKLKDRPVRCGINGCDNKWLWPALEQIEAYAKGCQRSAAPHVRQVQGRLRRDRRPRGPLPNVGLQEDLDLDAQRPARRVPGRQSAAQGAAPHVRELQRDLPDAAGHRTALPPLWMQEHMARQARRPARARRARQDRRSLSAVLRELLEGHRRARGPAAAVQDGQLHGDLDVGEGGAARGGRAAGAQGARAEAAKACRRRRRRRQRGGGRRRGGGRAARSRRGAAGKKGKKKRKREIKPPERRCQDCSDFLKDKKTLEIPCKQCATPIYWPPESQLQTHLGAWAEPSLCGACKRDVMEAARAIEREALRHPQPAWQQRRRPGRRRRGRRRGQPSRPRTKRPSNRRLSRSGGAVDYCFGGRELAAPAGSPRAAGRAPAAAPPRPRRPPPPARRAAPPVTRLA